MTAICDCGNGISVREVGTDRRVKCPECGRTTRLSTWRVQAISDRPKNCTSCARWVPPDGQCLYCG